MQQARYHMENTESKQDCQNDNQSWREYREDIPAIVDNLVASCDLKECFDRIAIEPIPSKSEIIEIIQHLQRILYPGYLISETLDDTNLRYHLGQESVSLFEKLSRQLELCIRHDCIRNDLPCTGCAEKGRQEGMNFMQGLPNLRKTLAKDVLAAMEGDPAAGSYDEIIFCYPGLQAVTVYRIAHQLYKQGISLMPRIMSEYAHGLTGIDIHPGADIGESFFIDHGTGVVIGQTAEIGNRVRLYQGVTLGALALPRDAGVRLRGKKRHPTIEDDVIIYAGATILGGRTVIGARSVIGGNVWLTESIPQDTTVFLKNPELVVKNNPKRTAREKASLPVLPEPS
jgi:serine O-acetyltransferase